MNFNIHIIISNSLDCQQPVGSNYLVVFRLPFCFHHAVSRYFIRRSSGDEDARCTSCGHTFLILLLSRTQSSLSLHQISEKLSSKGDMFVFSYVVAILNFGWAVSKLRSVKKEPFSFNYFEILYQSF